MVKVPLGEFRMGDSSLPDSSPVRRVTITSDYLLGKYEITNEQFCIVVNYLIQAVEKPSATAGRAGLIVRPANRYSTAVSHSSILVIVSGLSRSLCKGL
jgi:formylglycine-generating enzyme required for sulfatase activity